MDNLGLYPLKFKPIFLDKIWGGSKIRTKLGMDFSPLPNCGEVWVLSGYEQNESIVENGFLAGNGLNELVEVYMGDLVGESVYEKFGNEFPILVKFIDAADYLSIQVHPDDEYAARKRIGRGKSEMWYVIDADTGSELISGFNQPVNKVKYLDQLNNKKLIDILNVEKVTKGDVFHLPAGRVHAIGPGLLLAEIQETSDNTFRIYDWDRLDDQGRSRELHTEKALEVINFEIAEKYKTSYLNKPNIPATLVKSEHFTTNYLFLTKPANFNYHIYDSFVSHICIEGSGKLDYDGGSIPFKLGDCILIPNELESIRIEPNDSVKILEVYLEPEK